MELLNKLAVIYEQQSILDKTESSREFVNLRTKEKLNKADQIFLTPMLPVKLEKGNCDFTFIDLFAGIGGIRIGFERAGGKCVFTSEYNKYAVKTYLANHYCDHPVCGDIREITQIEGKNKEEVYSNIQKQVPDHDLLLAGFPCQPFSIAGVSKKNALGVAHGFEDSIQGTLFFDIARIIKVKKPLAIMLENVKNLKNHDRGKTFKIIIKTLYNLGYYIVDSDFYGCRHDPKIINGNNFVPQNRERIVIVAFRRDLGGSEGLTLRDVKKYFPKTKLVVGDILEPKEAIDDKYILTPKLWEYLKSYANKHKKAGNGFGFSKVKAEDSYTRTLSARYHKDGSEILIDRGSTNIPRRLTPRECARLMGFDKPSESKFLIPVSDTQAYKQFGNSVVVPVFEAVAKLMKPYIVRAKSNKEM